VANACQCLILPGEASDASCEEREGELDAPRSIIPDRVSARKATLVGAPVCYLLALIPNKLSC
jgi:hypothetical protein